MAVVDNRMLPILGLAIGVTSSLIGGVGSIVLGNLNGQITDLKSDNREMHQTLATLLTLNAQIKDYDAEFSRVRIEVDEKLDRNVFDVSRTSILDRIDTLVKTNDIALQETLHQVHDLENKIVSREENVVHWNAIDALTLRMNGLAERQCK